MRGRAHVGLRPVAIIGYHDAGVAGAWAGPALRRFEGAKTKTIVTADLTAAFERELDAIAHDVREFPEVEIVGHRVRHARGTAEFAVTVDRQGGVDVDLCERIAARINAALEPCGGVYSLEVQSAGLERPLVRPADYQRFAGRRARVVTNLTVNGGKTHRGVLRGLRGESAILQTDGGELPLPLATIKSAHLEYDPRADLQRDKRQRKRPHADG